MDKLIDLGMTKLFQLAEYVCSKAATKREQSQTCLSYAECEQARLEIKAATKREQSQTCLSYAEREQARLEIKAAIKQVEAKSTSPQPQQEPNPTIRFSDADRMVEGELFKD